MYQENILDQYWKMKRNGRKIIRMIRLMLVFSFICPLISVGQNFTVEYEEKLLEIDSVVLFDYENNRVDKYINLTKYDLAGKKLITVIYFGRKKKLCLYIPYSQIFCDKIEIELDKFPKCKSVYETVGEYRTCQGMGHVISFHSNYFPCCNKKELRKIFEG